MNTEELLKEAVTALEAAKKMNDHLFDTKLKPVNWGETFCDWALLNESLLAVDCTLVKIKKEMKNEKV